jgi:replicative DNA helicase
LSALDKQLGGLQPSDLIIIAGRPSIGKTAFALNLAQNASLHLPRKTVALFSLEMAGEQIVQRLISNMTGIDGQQLRLGRVTDEEYERMTEAIGRLSEAPMFIDDTPAATPNEIRSKARRLYAERGVDLIVIDYLQLMHGGGRSENRVQEIAQISRSLKALARELKVPVIALSQLSRAVESRTDKRPQLSDLRESGSIEQDADVVMFLYRDDAYDKTTERPNIAEVIVAKHRNGPTGTIELYYNRPQSRFADLDYYKEDESEMAF